MKTILKSILYVSLTSLILTGCANNDDFTTPNLTGCVELKATNTIANFKTSATDKATAISSDDIIEGVVVSSDAGGSVFKEIFIVSEDGQESIRVRVDAYSTYGTYGVGQKVYIKLKGLFVQKDPVRKIVALGADGSLAAIKDYNKYILKGCKIISGKEFDDTFNNKVSLKEALDEKYIGKLVTIPEVQFKKEFRGKIFASNTTGDFTKVAIEGKEPSSASFYFNVSKNAKGFANEIVPDKSGSMTGIMTRYNAEYQLVPRTMHDLDLTKDPFEGDDSGEGETLPQHDIKITGSLAWAGADFKEFDAFMGALEEFNGVKLKDYATKAIGLGWDKSDALAIKGKPTGNDFVFTVVNNKVPVDAEAITFLLKGKANGKSISINVYNEDGTKYDTAFNLGTVGADDITLNKAIPNDKGAINDYNGSVNTKGRWIKVTLNLKGAKYNTTAKGKFFAFKVGKDGDYDILVDEFRVVGGKDDGGTTGPEVPNDGKMNVLGKEGSFKDLLVLNNQGIVVSEGEGKDKGVGIKVEGTSTNNASGFSITDIKVPANAKNIVFYVKGESTPGGKDKDRGTFVVNMLKDKEILANYSIKDGLNNGKTGELVVIGVNDNGNSYVGTIKTSGWVKVVLPLKDININNTGIGGFLQFRFAKDGKFSVMIDKISFE